MRSHLPLSFLLFALLAGSLLPQLEVGGILHCHDLFQTQRPEQRQFELNFRPECRIDCQNHKNNGINGQNRCALCEIGGDIGHHVHHIDDADQRNDWPKGNFECARRLRQTAAHRAGYLPEDSFKQQAQAARDSLSQLRQGMFAKENRGRTDLAETEEGYALSKNLLAKGYVEEDELKAFPAARASVHGVHPVIECTQNIPCNPCQDACKFGCILVDKQITNIPVVDREKKCTGCGMCVASCSGQALFLVNDDFEEKRSTITLAYEFLPYPEKGQPVTGHFRSDSSPRDFGVLSAVKSHQAGAHVGRYDG